MDCVRTALITFRESGDGIFEEVLSLCSPGTIVRTKTLPHGDLMSYMQYDVDLAPFYKLINEQIVQSATEHNIPVARVDTAFHGLTGDEDARAKGLMSDVYNQPSFEGMKVLAELLRELGYEPTVK